MAHPTNPELIATSNPRVWMTPEGWAYIERPDGEHALVVNAVLDYGPGLGAEMRALLGPDYDDALVALRRWWN